MRHEVRRQGHGDENGVYVWHARGAHVHGRAQHRCAASTMPHGGKVRSAKERGCIPHHPVILVPGYMSSCLAVEESPWKDWSDRRIWLSMQAMGFEKVFTDAFPVLKKYSEGRKAEVKNKERKKATSTHDIELSEKVRVLRDTCAALCPVPVPQHAHLWR